MKVEHLYGRCVKSPPILELEYLLQEESPDIFFSLGFRKGGQVVVTRAPARLDVMGGIADYCGANVFEMPLNRTAVAACQAREDGVLSAITLQAGRQFRSNFHIPLDRFYRDGVLKTYPEIQACFRDVPGTEWTGYILGAFYVLLKERKIDRFPHGATVLLKSDIPIGGGVASSAAIEVAALLGICRLYGLELEAMEVARLAQLVENRVVGAPCGSMDQVAVAAGRSAHLLSLLCQPATLLEYVARPPRVSFVGIYTKIRRSTASTAYVDTRTGTFMGLTLLKSAFSSGAVGLEAKIAAALSENYLCNLSVSEFREQCEPLLPEELEGSAFLETYGETVDTATQVDPKKVYPIRSRVQHAVYENARVKRFIAALKRADTDPGRIRDHLSEAGGLMYESNASYRDLAGLGAREVEGLVHISRKIGEQGGIYGAKITGGGGGGTVALLCYGNVETALTQILAAYKLAWGIDAEVLRGDAPGAFEFGHLLWELKTSDPPTHF